MKYWKIASGMPLAIGLAVSTPTGAQSGRAVTGDAVMMEQARSACHNRDFKSFLDAFISSQSVQRRYSAPQVGLGALAAPDRTTETLPAGQLAFEIALVDYMYADAASVRRWEVDRAHPYVMLSIDRKTLPDGGWRVGYQPAIFHDGGEGGEGMTLVRRIGKPRAYIFSPVDGCWNLTRALR